MDTEIITGMVFLLACGGWAAYSLKEQINKEAIETKPVKNYKNISQMAQNLSICSVETRAKVLIELQEDQEWSKDELEDLKGVLGGMLRKKVLVNESGDERTGLKIKYAERE